MALTRREFLQLSVGYLLHEATKGKENEAAPFPLGFHFPFHYLGVPAQVEAAKRFLSRGGGNMVVIDIKDESGNVSLEVDHRLAPKARYAKSLIEFVNWLRAEGVYVVCRQVVASDSVLVRQHPDLGLKDKWGSQITASREAAVDLYQPEIGEFQVAIGARAVEIGFDEVQLDYIRFPDTISPKYVNHLGENTAESRSMVVAGVLAAVKRAVNERGGILAMDCFGYTAWKQNSDQGIGQLLEIVGPHVDVLSPMAYPSTYGAGLQEPCSGGCKPPAKYPYEIVYWTTYRALERLALVNPGAIVRPWIQAYAPLVKNADIAKQTKAANDAGAVGMMCWNDYGNYPRLYP